MRAYFFGNMYLSSIQQGIQAAHVMSEMFPKYEPCSGGQYDSEEHEMLSDWAMYHKTMILLNGGYMETIVELRDFIRSGNHSYPWAEFHEGEDALGGILTSIGIILPEKIYQLSAVIRNPRIIDNSTTVDPTVQIPQTGKWHVRSDAKFNDTGEAFTWEYSKWEYDLAQRLTQFGLAS